MAKTLEDLEFEIENQTSMPIEVIVEGNLLIIKRA
jgi:hypothetical protein